MKKISSALSLIFLLFLSLNLTIYGQITSESESSSPTNENKPNSDSQAKERHLETFEIVWQTINDNYFDENFGGVDWAKIKIEFEPQVKKAKNDTELHQLLEKMIGRLNRSHFAIIPPDVFVAIEEAKMESERLSKEITEEQTDDDDSVFDIADKPSQYGLGIDLRLIRDDLIITKVEENSAAANKGLKTGYILEKINGVSIKEFLEAIKPSDTTLKSFEKKIGFQIIEFLLNGEKDTFVQITVLNKNNQAQTFIIKREKLPGEYVKILSNVGNQYLTFEHKSINQDIGYLKFNFFALDVIEKFCTTITEFKDKKALIIDLRGNKGGLIGSVMGVSSFLSQSRINIGTEINRKTKEKREVEPHKKTFDGKVYILVDGQSYSAAEMFAAAMKENNIATIVGQTSAGEALPSLTKTLPTGAVFQFPVANFITPKGNYLEGIGVRPNVEISLDRQSLLNGIDKQLNSTIGLANSHISKLEPNKIITKPPPPPPPRVSTRVSSRRTRRITKIHQIKALRVIDDFISKIGGVVELTKLNSYKADGLLEIRRSGALVEGGVEISWIAPNKSVETYTIDGAGTISEVFDGKSYFIESGFTGSDEITVPIILEDKSLSMGFYEILNLRKSYRRILYQGVFTIDDAEMHLIETFTENGLNVAFLFNAKTKLLYKRTSNYSGDVFFENYQFINKTVLMPFTVRKGEVFTFKFDEIIPNAKIDQSKFIRKVSCFDKVD